MSASEDYVDHGDFEEDLVEYLKDESMENWGELVDNYPFKAEGGDRFVFLPTGHENVDPGSRSDFLVQRPQHDTGSAIDVVDDDIYAELSSYMQTDDAVEKLEKLAELEDRYDHTWISDDTVRFGPTPENGVTVSVPSLDEIVEAYNSRDDSGVDADERDLLSTVASESSHTIGTMSKTVYVQGDQVFVEDDQRDEFYRVRSVGEALGLDEALDVYRMVREDDRPDSGKDIFDNISRVFEAGEIDSYRVIMDSENEKIMLLDTDTIDMAVMDFEEANEWLSLEDEDEDIMGRIDDFYNRLTQDDED